MQKLCFVWKTNLLPLVQIWRANDLAWIFRLSHLTSFSKTLILSIPTQSFYWMAAKTSPKNAWNSTASISKPKIWLKRKCASNYSRKKPKMFYLSKTLETIRAPYALKSTF